MPFLEPSNNLKPFPSLIFFSTLFLGSGGKSLALTFLGFKALHALWDNNIKIDNKIVTELADYSKRKEEIEISLQKQEIKYGNKVAKFELDAFKKKCLIEGLDDIALSMEKISKIDEYEKKIQNTKPWVLNND